MAIIDTVKQLMKGRSEKIEQVIDRAVTALGRSSASLKDRAETVKSKARDLDADRVEPLPGVAEVGGTTATDTESAAPVPPVRTAPVPAPPAPAPSLRGDLVDPPEVPPVP